LKVEGECVLKAAGKQIKYSNSSLVFHQYGKFDPAVINFCLAVLMVDKQEN
jgi:hypothetical protein